jgi:molybdopterin-guanine dinucleotide biosynthesis protein A
MNMNTNKNMSINITMDMRMHRVAGVVLCGGRSSRMGMDKSRLEYGGLMLYEHMRHTLRLAGIENVFLSGPDGIQDVLPDRGPLGGMHACMHAMAGQFSHALFVPTDMPLLTAEQIRKLAWHDSDAEALYYLEQTFPLKLSLSPQTRGKLTLQLMTETGSGRSIKNFIRSLQRDSLPTGQSNQASFTNINTPQEWQALNISRERRGF